MNDGAKYVARWEVGDVGGTVVVVDVLRAFTTAAYAFAGGTSEIWLVSGVDEALALRRSVPGALVMGEVLGRRATGFDLSNSPVEIAAAYARFPDQADSGLDDLITAQFVESVRLGRGPDPSQVAQQLRQTSEARLLMAATGDDGHPDDVTLAAQVDRFDLAMEVFRDDGKLRLRPVVSGGF